MNFKDFFIKHKKLITTVLSSIIVGTGIGIIGSPSEAEYNDYLTKNTELLSKIDRLNTSIKANEISIEDLTHKKSTLQLEKDTLTKEKQKVEEEAKQKAEDESKLQAEKKAKAEEEVKLQAEKKAKAEEEAKVQTEERAKSQEDFKANTGRNPETKSSTHSNSKKSTSDNSVREPIGQMVWKTSTGKKYHSTNHCGNTNPSNASKISLSDAKATGLGKCSKCF